MTGPISDPDADCGPSPLAVDLHDHLGPHLFALNAALAQAQAAAQHVSGPGLDSLREGLDAAAAHAATIRHGLRDVMNNDHPPPDTGTLPGLIAEFALIAPQVRIETAQSDAPCDPAIWRFLRESLLNAIRHGQARQIDIALTAADGAVTARVTDDGSGPSGAPPNIGLSGIARRARALGGSFIPPHRQGHHTVTEFRIPMR